MRQILALILVSIIAFAGIIFIKDFRLNQQKQKDSAPESTASDSTSTPEPKSDTPAETTPDAQKDTVAPPAQEPTPEITAKAPPELIGIFAIDKDTTQQWLTEKEYGSELDIEAVVSIWPLLLIEFDGKTFEIDSGTTKSKQYFQPTEQSEEQLTIPLNLLGNTKPTPYTIIWDDKGFWLTYPDTKPGSDEDFTIQIRFKKLGE